MLDAHAKAHDVKGHLLRGAFDSEKHIKCNAYCRILRYANRMRIAIKELKRKAIPQQECTKIKTLTKLLPLHDALNDKVCAKVAATALEENSNDWVNKW